MEAQRTWHPRPRRRRRRHRPCRRAYRCPGPRAPRGARTPRCAWRAGACARQGRTLVHYSAQRKHILWDTLVALNPPSQLDRGTRGGVTKTAEWTSVSPWCPVLYTGGNCSEAVEVEDDPRVRPANHCSPRHLRSLPGYLKWRSPIIER